MAAAPKVAGDAAQTALIGTGEQNYLKAKAQSLGVDLAAVLADHGGLVPEKLSRADFAVIKTDLLARGA